MTTRVNRKLLYFRKKGTCFVKQILIKQNDSCTFLISIKNSKGGFPLASEQATNRNKKLSWDKKTWLLVLGIIFIATTLRSPLTAVGPIIADIKEGLTISNVWAGLITTIPLLAFAVISPFVPKISQRVGFERTLLSALILLAIGILMRSAGSIFFLFFGTIIIGVAISFGNVLLPALIKLKFPLQVGLLTALYSVSMNLSASIAAGVSNPIAETTIGWKGALACWGILAILAIIVWLPQLRNHVKVTNNNESSQRTKPMWKYPLTWAITFTMGLQSLLFYTTATWIPGLLETQGMSPSKAGWMFSILQIAQLPMTFLTPILAGKKADQRPLVALLSLFYFAGFAGIFMNWTELTLLWMLMIGFAGGASFSLSMMLFSLRSRNAQEAAELSGTAQSIGYLLAAIGPVLYGFIHDSFNSWHAANSLYLIVTVLLFVFAFISAKDRFVTKEQ